MGENTTMHWVVEVCWHSVTCQLLHALRADKSRVQYGLLQMQIRIHS
jgi:hypothetical protein